MSNPQNIVKGKIIIIQGLFRGYGQPIVYIIKFLPLQAFISSTI